MPTEDEQTAKYFSNQALFSDHYLVERMDAHPEWEEDIGDAFAQLQELYEAKRDILEGLNEAQTEDEFIRPLLRDVLGFEFEVQTSVTRQGRLNWPDYALFTRAQDKAEAQRFRDQEGAYYARAAAVADAKYWGRPLDRKVDDARDELSNANPSFQIVNYLVATGVDWGVLTNGQLWRLYYAHARSRVDTYFEVDLARILESDNVEAFRYFYLFFRAAAFERDPQTDQSFLEAVYEGSVNYGVELEKRLKDLIFERIFVHLATGFLAYRRTNGGVTVETQESLAEVYQGTLRLLYRLLFLLHAEARGLLPVEDRHGYYGYSLTHLKRDVAHRIGAGQTLSPVSTDIWNDLGGLFRIIDRGDPALNVPRYNGGLFRRDNPKNAFLNTHRMADVYLAPALALLTRERDPETGQHRFIDYKSLNVEQLGSIYEGLLEFHLRIAERDLAVTKSKGAEVYRPVEEVSNPLKVIRQDELYLENDKGERKATGSYYTPHYIVEYIVEQTLGPVLGERAGRFRELMDEIEPRRQRVQEIEGKLAADPDRADAWVTRWKDERRTLLKKLEPWEREAVDALLGVKVCDPAMGSGHFLVYATDWLAEHLIVVLNEFPQNPVLRRIADIRQQIVEELARQGIEIDAEQLKDTSLLKRMVMKRCIYGVDLNPMATELAKLSLWLDSFTVGAPLSFLNHHLKVGNSLIGAQVDEVRQALEAEDTGQIHMFGGPFAGLLTATSLMRDVAAYTDATFQEVEQSAEKYAAFEKAMLPYKRVLDLWVSRHFGNDRADEFLRLYGQEALQAVVDEDVDLASEYRQAVDKARALWRERRFFHWELEFPEVFIDLERSDWKQNPGFDAVMGNPPYGYRVTGEIDEFMDASLGRAESENIAEYFVEQCFQVLAKPSNWGMIIPKQVLHTPTWQDVRMALHQPDGVQVNSIIDVSEAFGEVLLEQVIVVASERPIKRIRVGLVKGDLIIDDYSLDASKLSPRLWPIYAFDEFEATFEKIGAASVPLGDVASLFFGIKNIKSELTVDKGIPMIIGDNIARYRFVGTFPRLPKEYLSPSMTKRHLKKKLVVQRIVAHVTKPHPRIIPMATFDEEALLAFDTVTTVVLTAEEYSYHYLLALINSTFAAWYLHRFVFNFSTRTMGFRKGFADHLPIRRIEFTTPADERERLVAAGITEATEWIESTEKASVDSVAFSAFSDSKLGRWLSARLAADGSTDTEHEQADVVHDLLAHLAERMIELHKQRQRLGKALDPFKFLDRGIPFIKFTDAFADEIKYGERVKTFEVSETSKVYDLSAVHHDVDGLRLVPSEVEGWELQVQLKLRDPDADWQEWQYEEGENRIARQWAPVYRLPLSDEKARYYQHAFQVLGEFANAKSFPGGYTRTTMKKLQLARVPAFDPDADLTPLVELSQELVEVQARIARTDRLIDQIVYRLYGLTEEEVAVVEGRSGA